MQLSMVTKFGISWVVENKQVRCRKEKKQKMNFITLKCLQTIYVNNFGKIFEKWALVMEAKVAQVTK